jgi:predicted RNase H-like HicB family nuclease
MRYIIVTFTITREGEQYVSRCPELGTASFGRDEEEALNKLADATGLYLDTLEDLGERARVLQEKKTPGVSETPGVWYLTRKRIRHTVSTGISGV